MATGRANLPASVTSRRSSAGICHVGRKRDDFGAFIAEYVLQSRSDEAEADFDARDDAGGGLGGFFVSAEDRTSAVAPHGGLARYTVGQRAKIGGASEPWFVVGKDAARDVAYVARGKDHAALFTRAAVAAECFWVAGTPPFEGEEEEEGEVEAAAAAAGGFASHGEDAVRRRGGGVRGRAVPRGEAPGVRATASGRRRGARRSARRARGRRSRCGSTRRRGPSPRGRRSCCTTATGASAGGGCSTPGRRSTNAGGEKETTRSSRQAASAPMTLFGTRRAAYSGSRLVPVVRRVVTSNPLPLPAFARRRRRGPRPGRRGASGVPPRGCVRAPPRA